VAAACLLAAACQPLYGGKPEKLHNPEKKKRPPDAPEAAVEIKYVEDCAADFRKDPKGVRSEPSIANDLVGQGETAMVNGDKAKDPKAQTDLFRDGIDKFRNALVKDPYNVEATLKLAVAYDKVYRKGCALQMLRRLVSLSSNPKWSKEANRACDSVVDNTQWFKGYRKDAVSAAGR
jgi:hypothetical protein